MVSSITEFLSFSFSWMSLIPWICEVVVIGGGWRIPLLTHNGFGVDVESSSSEDDESKFLFLFKEQLYKIFRTCGFGESEFDEESDEFEKKGISSDGGTVRFVRTHNFYSSESHYLISKVRG